jgi:hypothetical protein
MIRVQILNVTVPAQFQDSGGVFVDLGDTDLSLNRVAEELNEINQIRYGGARQFTVPDSPKNILIFQEFISPTPHDFDYTPLECRIYVGSSVLEETKIGARRSLEASNSLELIATKKEDYWLIGAQALRLPQIPYEDIELTRANIEDSWNNNYQYSDGDIGIHFTKMYMGRPYKERKMTVEYMRWTYHLLRLLREGFRTFGWCFLCEALETNDGRQIAAYLIDPNAYSREDLIEANKATAETGEIERDQQYRISGGGIGPLGGLLGSLLGGKNVYGYHFVTTFDTVTYDPGSNMLNGRYNGFGVFLFTVTIQYCPADIRSNIVKVEFYVSDADSSRIAYEEEFKPLDDLIGDPTDLQEKVIETELALQVDQSVTVAIYAESTHKSIKIKNMFLNVLPKAVYPQRGETINPANYLRNDTLLDVLKGWVHTMRGKIDVIPGEKTIAVFPNFETDFFNETLEGYYTDNLIDVTAYQVNNSSVVDTPAAKPNRFQLIRWKQSTDPWIARLRLDRLSPLYSKTVDLGEQFKPEYTEYVNPYFEPTYNDWVYDFSPQNSESVPVNLPILLDHIPEKGKAQISVDIGPRLLYLTDQLTQDWEAENGLQAVKLGWEDTTKTFIGRAYMRSPFNNMAEQVNLVFADPLFEIENTLFNVFWRAWLYGTVLTSKVNVLAIIRGGEYFRWSFRDGYKVDVRGKSTLCNLLSIDDFNPSSGISTPMTLQPRGAGGIVSTPDNDDICDTYSYELQITRVGDTYNFSIVTDNPDTGTIEWRYEGVTTWTTAASLANPTGPFFVRYTQTGGPCEKTIVKFVDPCGNNTPTILIDYEVDEAGQDCVTATIGGILNDPILSTALEYDLDDAGSWAAYTPGNQICGNYTKICFRGTIEFDNTCDDYTLPETCFEIPPNQDCVDNFPEITIIHEGLDAFRFDIGGSYQSNIGEFHFFYKEIGQPEYEAKRWTDQNPIVGTNYEVRLWISWCDDCPPYCSPWTPVVEPAGLMAPAALEAAPEWDFSKVPDDRKEEIKDMIERGARADLARMHNELALSEYDYCCGADLNHAYKWWRWALDNGKLD